MSITYNNLPNVMSLETKSTIDEMAARDSKILGEALPMLKVMQEEEKVVSGFMPYDAPVFPNENVVLYANEYMSRREVSNKGVWNLEVGSNIARFHTAPIHGGIDYRFEVKEEGGSFREATPIEVDQYAQLIGFISEHYGSDNKPEQRGKKISRRDQIISKLGSLGLGQVRLNLNY